MLVVSRVSLRCLLLSVACETTLAFTFVPTSFFRVSLHSHPVVHRLRPSAVRIAVSERQPVVVLCIGGNQGKDGVSPAREGGGGAAATSL